MQKEIRMFGNEQPVDILCGFRKRVHLRGANMRLLSVRQIRNLSLLHQEQPRISLRRYGVFEHRRNFYVNTRFHRGVDVLAFAVSALAFDANEYGGHLAHVFFQGFAGHDAQAHGGAFAAGKK